MRNVSIIMLLLVGCSSEKNPDYCVPGQTRPCTLGGCNTAAQPCGSDWLYGACACADQVDGGTDAPVPRDAQRDAETQSDAEVQTDARGTAEVGEACASDNNCAVELYCNPEVNLCYRPGHCAPTAAPNECGARQCLTEWVYFQWDGCYCGPNPAFVACRAHETCQYVGTSASIGQVYACVAQ